MTLKFWIITALVVIFIIYLIWGGNRTYDVVGLKRLQNSLSVDGIPVRILSDYQDVSEPILSSSDPQNFQISRGECSNLNISHDKELKVDEESSHKTEFTFNPYKSRGEEITCRALEQVLGRKVQVGVRNLGIINPETGRQLEIDCYDPVEKIGVEYNGAQHYLFSPKYHKTEHDFMAQLRRDAYKSQQCSNMDICLISVPYTVDTCELTHDKPKRRTPNQRFKRVKDYLSHVITAMRNGNRPQDHYTASFE
jgi:hypothetical protein